MIPQKREIIGDKLAGKNENQGIISKNLPRQVLRAAYAKTRAVSWKLALGMNF